MSRISIFRIGTPASPPAEPRASRSRRRDAAASAAGTAAFHNTQEGFTLAGLIVILTIIAMVIAYTVPEQWSMIMGRERDRQTIFLMKQYARSIKGWSAKNGGMPTSLEQITDARRPRMIRGNGKWACPLTGKEDDWILVPYAAIQPSAGQAQSGLGQFRKESSPREYVGPFVAVRPNASGKSFIAFKGAEDYSEWVFTIFDLEQEIAAKNAAATMN